MRASMTTIGNKWVHTSEKSSLCQFRAKFLRLGISSGLQVHGIKWSTYVICTLETSLNRNWDIMAVIQFPKFGIKYLYPKILEILRCNNLVLYPYSLNPFNMLFFTSWNMAPSVNVCALKWNTHWDTGICIYCNSL